MSVGVVVGAFCLKVGVNQLSDLVRLDKKAVFAWDWSSLCVARVIAICYGSNCQSWHVTQEDSRVTPIIYLRFNLTFSLLAFSSPLFQWKEPALSFIIDGSLTEINLYISCETFESMLIYNNLWLFEGHFDPVWWVHRIRYFPACLALFQFY